MWSVTLEEMLLDTPQPHDVADDEFRASAERITMASHAEGPKVRKLKALYRGRDTGVSRCAPEGIVRRLL